MFIIIVHPVILLVPNRNNYEEIKYFVTRSFFHFLTWCCWKADRLSISQTALYLQPTSPGILSDTFTKSTNTGSVEYASCLEAHVTSRNLSNAPQSNRDSRPGFCLPGASWSSSVTSCPAMLSRWSKPTMWLHSQKPHLRFFPSCSLSHEPTLRKWDDMSNQRRHLHSLSFSQHWATMMLKT